jgi:hypothetical protein
MDILIEEKEAPRTQNWELERARVLAQNICELPLKIEGTILESNIQQLYKDMEQKGLVFRPKCYLSDEWGCPDGIPIIGIPFYLADKKLSRIEEEYTGNLEHEDEIIMYLRHEAGHAFNYAYELYKTDDWHEVFGPYSRPYREDYKANPLSKKYVKYSTGWYAQKHPDEDFAETFAVWLTPGLDWRKQYEGWGALRKLEYVDRICREVGKEQPKVAELMEDRPVSDIKLTILEYYERHHSKEYPKIVTQLGAYLDGDLREIFEPKKEDDWRPAGEFITAHRITLQNLIHYWTGTSIKLVRGLIRYLAERTQVAGIYYDPKKEQTYLLQLEAFLLTLTMNYRYTDRFMEI